VWCGAVVCVCFWTCTLAQRRPVELPLCFLLSLLVGVLLFSCSQTIPGGHLPELPPECTARGDARLCRGQAGVVAGGLAAPFTASHSDDMTIHGVGRAHGPSAVYIINNISNNILENNNVIFNGTKCLDGTYYNSTILIATLWWDVEACSSLDRNGASEWRHCPVVDSRQRVVWSDFSLVWTGNKPIHLIGARQRSRSSEKTS
jgi:hypothetical protein